MRQYCEEQQREALTKLRTRNMVGVDKDKIRTKCATEWPDDYRMRDYCEERQLEAMRQLYAP
jgi:hypothetical protein